MSREYAGRYAAKHPPGTPVPPEAEKAIRSKLAGNSITCRDAHEIAASLGLTPQAVGVAVDLLGVRISRCQLGLFGHGRGRESKPVASKLDPDLQSAIRAALVDGRLPCAAAWHIADTRGIQRAEVGLQCNALALKISKCQLGAF